MTPRIILLIFLILYFQLCESVKKKQKTQKCLERSFDSKNLVGNECEGNDFCDKLNHRCVPCSLKCFNLLDGALNDTKGDVSVLTKEILEKYGFSYDLQNFYKEIYDKIPHSHSQIEEIGENIKNIDEIITEIRMRIGNLEKNVNEKSSLEFGNHTNNDDLISSFEKVKKDLKDMKKQIEVIKTKISDINFDQNLDKNVLNLSMDLLNVSKILSKSFDDSFEGGEDPLRLAFSLENDLDQLERILLTKPDPNLPSHEVKMDHLIENLNEIIKSVIEGLVKLFDDLESTENLITLTSEAERETKLGNTKLKDFLSKEKELVDILNQNQEVTLEVEKLLKDLRKTNTKMAELDEHANKVREHLKLLTKEIPNIKATFESDLSKYQKLQNDYLSREKLLKNHEQTLDELLDEVKNLKEYLTDFENDKTIDELTLEVNEMMEEAGKYREKFLEYCREKYFNSTVGKPLRRE